MPPRKRARGSAASTPLHETQPKTPITEPALPTTKENAAESGADDILNDPWTDDQMTALFKAIVRYPPKGRHI